jgi:branched-chain amino acid transport system ATP-binding protein
MRSGSVSSVDLVVEHVTRSFGGLRAVSDVSLTVREGTIFGLIGPNGAGKTTLFNLVTGIYAPDAGSIRFGGAELRGKRPAKVATAGIGRTFQNIRLFGELTVLENLLVAGHALGDAAGRARAAELLGVFGLAAASDARPTELSYGDQRRVEIARALMAKPKLLLLDEPAAGMNHVEAEALQARVRRLRDEMHVSIVLVEHNMQVVMGVCDELHVLDHGETIARGTPAEVRADAKVIAAYLGEAT